MNTLSAMSESTEVLSQRREDAQEVPILFRLARRAAILVLAVLVIAYVIVTFAVGEAKALWSRGHVSPKQ
jgi:hypothetical protein